MGALLFYPTFVGTVIAELLIDDSYLWWRVKFCERGRRWKSSIALRPCAGSTCGNLKSAILTRARRKLSKSMLAFPLLTEQKTRSMRFFASFADEPVAP